jgi:ADP-ribose pyrophosphatase YjhB (NUDIX family)
MGAHADPEGLSSPLLGLLDELQTIARNGLEYTTDPFDRERYAQLLAVTVAAYGAVLDVPALEIRARLAREFGYITPKVGADAAIFDDAGRILVMRRSDDGRWCLPGGWVNPNESPAQAAVRETQEETGLVVRPVKLVDVFFRPPHETYGPHSAVAIVYRCEAFSGALAGSHESSELAYRRLEDIETWHEQHEQYAKAAAATRDAG